MAVAPATSRAGVLWNLSASQSIIITSPFAIRHRKIEVTVVVDVCDRDTTGHLIGGEVDVVRRSVGRAPSATSAESRLNRLAVAPGGLRCGFDLRTVGPNRNAASDCACCRRRDASNRQPRSVRSGSFRCRRVPAPTP